MKKKIVSITIIFILLLSCFSFSYASNTNDITIYINGKILNTEVDPTIQDGRTMVPMRDIFEAMGSTVHWDPAEKMITAVKDLTVIYMTVDLPLMFVNNASTPLDIAPLIKDSRTLVPARAVAESFGAEVTWDGANRIVNIKSDERGYVENSAVPDFGKIYNCKEIKKETSTDSGENPMTIVVYKYNANLLPSSVMQEYLKALPLYGFEFSTAKAASGNGSLSFFKHTSKNIYVVAGRSDSEYIVSIGVAMPII
jgi:hypothetical protein